MKNNKKNDDEEITISASQLSNYKHFWRVKGNIFCVELQNGTRALLPVHFLMMSLRTGGPELAGGRVKRTSKPKLVGDRHVELTYNTEKLRKQDDIVSDADIKLQKLSGNLYFPFPWPSEFIVYTDFVTHVATAKTKLLARKQRVPGAAHDLKMALGVLKVDIRSIGKMVQLLMDQPGTTADEAIKICESAGFTWVMHEGAAPGVKGVYQTVEPGTLAVFAEGTGYFDWQQRIDGTNVAVRIAPSREQEMFDRGLDPTKKYWYRFRMVLIKGQYGEWSDWFGGISPLGS